MKVVAAFCFSLFSSALASPAIVWKKTEQQGATPLRTSKSLAASDLLLDVLSEEAEDSSLEAVVFLLGRNKDGSESLSQLASSNALPKIAVKYGHADAIHHNVKDVKSASVFVREFKEKTGLKTVHSVTLDEFKGIMSSQDEPIKFEVSENGLLSKTQKALNHRTALLAEAKALVVDIDPSTCPSAIDKAVDSAIDSDSVKSVVLASVRSLEEVKLERMMANKEMQKRMESDARRFLEGSSRRRLEEENDDGQNDDQANENLSSIAYVSMTPNIMAGLLFWVMFASVAFLGISCLGMIQGQDVYVKKMPSIGREA